MARKGVFVGICSLIDHENIWRLILAHNESSLAVVVNERIFDISLGALFNKAVHSMEITVFGQFCTFQSWSWANFLDMLACLGNDLVYVDSTLVIDV